MGESSKVKSAWWLFVLAEASLFLAAERLSLLDEHFLAYFNVFFVWTKVELPATNGALLPLSIS